MCAEGMFLTRKTTMMETIAQVDTRYPVTQALAYLFETNKVSPELEDKLRTELHGLLVESAKKFVGFQNVGSIRKALDITLGILSLAVVDSTKGEEFLEDWGSYIKTRGIKGVAQDAVGMIKRLVEIPINPSLSTEVSEQGPTARELLIHFATSHHRKIKTLWTGYLSYVSECQNREHAQGVKKALSFVVQHFVGQNPVSWFRMIQNMSELKDIPPRLEELLNTLLFRMCNNLTIKGDIVLSLKQLRKIRSVYVLDKKTWTKKTKERYLACLAQIPKELRGYLTHTGKDWFEMHLSDGPPDIKGKIKSEESLECLAGYHFKLFE